MGQYITTISLLYFYAKILESDSTHTAQNQKNFTKNIHGNIIYNSPNLETT
jgi:hypothetical protein